MKSTTFGLGSKKLAQLLKLGDKVPEGSSDRDADRAALLQEYLARKLPCSRTLQRHMRDGNQPSAIVDDPLGVLLTRTGVELGVLAAIKDYSKEQVVSAKTQEQTDVATVLYYAAIASALIHHQQSISRTPGKQLEQAFTQLARRVWLPTDLVTFFKQAKAQGMRTATRKDET